jgi:hypothetical protein
MATKPHRKRKQFTPTLKYAPKCDQIAVSRAASAQYCPRKKWYQGTRKLGIKGGCTFVINVINYRIADNFSANDLWLIKFFPEDIKSSSIDPRGA